MTSHQTAFLLACQSGKTVNELSNKLHMYRVTVSSVGRSLEKQGIVTSWRHGRDEWACLMYAPTIKGKELIEQWIKDNKPAPPTGAQTETR